MMLKMSVEDTKNFLKGFSLLLNAYGKTCSSEISQTLSLIFRSTSNKPIFSARMLERPIQISTGMISKFPVLLAQSPIILKELIKPLNDEISYSKTLHNNIPLTLPIQKSRPKPKIDEKVKIVEEKKLDKYSKERRVPSSRFGRIASFGTIGLGIGTIKEATKRTFGINSSSLIEGSLQSSSLFLTDSNLERIVDTLCRMRGAALKLGQMVSIQDESLVSPRIQKIFERVRQAADFMPVSQMHKVLEEEFGLEWRSKISSFEDVPFAAASIGQVHRARLLDGQLVAVKIQYPGVAESIDADIDNLMMLLKRLDILPKGLFADRAIAVAKAELSNECDYNREAEFGNKFLEILKDDPIYKVPKFYSEFSSKRVLTTEFVEGIPLDKANELSQDIRNWIGEQLLRLCLKELFVYYIMQTDPNWSNFLYNPVTGQIVLLDFGASRNFDKAFVDEYIKVIYSSSRNDRQGILTHSRNLGFLTGYENKKMEQAHLDAVSILGEAFASSEPFDFGKQSTTKRINALVPVMLEHRLTPPPDETYSLHRKMSGCFLLCSKLGAVISCKDLFDEIHQNYKFD